MKSGIGRWEMGDGSWEMEDGSWEMEDGSLPCGIAAQLLPQGGIPWGWKMEEDSCADTPLEVGGKGGLKKEFLLSLNDKSSAQICGNLSS